MVLCFFACQFLTLICCLCSFTKDLIGTLESNQTIVYMELGGNIDVDPALIDEVKSILEPREKVYKSKLSPNLDDVARIMERVRNNDLTLDKLNLRARNIGAREDALSMFDALADNTCIRTVDLSSNEIDDDCLSSISLALLENKSITRLNLANNAIYSEGAEYLIGTLDTNKTLVEINLEGNMIEHSVLEEINAILDERKGSTASVDTRGSSNLEAIIDRLTADDPNLVEIKLDGTNLAHSSETEDLIDALASNTYVRKVSLSNTGIDDTLMATLSLALVDNQTITHLSLRRNQIGSEGCEYVSKYSLTSYCACLKSNPHKHFLILCCYYSFLGLLIRIRPLLTLI